MLSCWLGVLSLLTQMNSILIDGVFPRGSGLVAMGRGLRTGRTLYHPSFLLPSRETADRPLSLRWGELSFPPAE